MEKLPKPSEKELVFHKIKPLLKIYRKVVWRLEESLNEVEATAYEYGGNRISKFVDFLCIDLDEFDSGKYKKEIEERLMSVSESKNLINIIDKALIKLKTHPENGEMYFNIIMRCYINKEMLSDEEIQAKLHMTQATFYRYKKDAIGLVGVILWGFILPSFREFWTLGVDNINVTRVAEVLPTVESLDVGNFVKGEWKSFDR